MGWEPQEYLYLEQAGKQKLQVLVQGSSCRAVDPAIICYADLLLWVCLVEYQRSTWDAVAVFVLLPKVTLWLVVSEKGG